MDAAQRADLGALYAELDAEIAAENPRCDISGRCCRFAEYGHTLFLSEAEAEHLFEVPPQPGGAECPYQIAGRCTARERRPLGCRVYFCDPNFAEQMPAISESAVRRLKDLHDRWGRPWDYRPLVRFLTDPGLVQGQTEGRENPLPILSQPMGQLDSSLCGE